MATDRSILIYREGKGGVLSSKMCRMMALDLVRAISEEKNAIIRWSGPGIVVVATAWAFGPMNETFRMIAN